MLLTRIKNPVVVFQLARWASTVKSAPYIQTKQAGYKFDNSRYGKNIVLIDGVRTPFLRSFTDYQNLSPYELQTLALRSLLKRVDIPKKEIDYVICGTVFHEAKTPNVAREAVFGAGLPMEIPGSTVTQACVSANQAITSAIGYINSGTYEIIIAGGVEFLSDTSIRLSPKMRKLLLEFNKAKTTKDKLLLLKKLRLDFFIPDYPSGTEFFTHETMGHSADRLATAFKVSRREQDEYALRSHTFADKAFKEGLLSDIAPVPIQGKGIISRDNGVRVSTMEKISKLQPAFIKPHGTITAANSSYFTDGATACLITTEEKAKELGLKPKAYLRQYQYVSIDPKDQLLLGPAYAITKTMNMIGLKPSEIDVWEFHEAFAGQTLANLKALDSEYFSKNYLGLSKPFGSPDMSKFNLWGGSLSLGHPFGATGVRLVTMAANRLIKENGRLAFVAACAAGGIGHGMLVERYSS